MNALSRFYLWKAMVPAVAVLLGSIGALLLLFWGVSKLEAARSRTTPFELVIPRCDAPFWVLITAGLILVNGIAFIRLWSLVIAEVARNPVSNGFQVVVPIPIARLLGVNCFYLGAAVLLFYVVRGALH